VELVVTATARDGAGIARTKDGRVVFVEGALPGETVTAEILDVQKRWSRGQVVEVLKASPIRVAVPCAHRLEGCGGCDLLHVDPGHQLAMKAGIVAEQLQRAGVEAPEATLHPLIDDHGRTTVRAAVVDGQAGYRMGGSHDVVIPLTCQAVDPLAEQILVDGRFGDTAEVTIRVGNRTSERLVLVEGDPSVVSVPDDVRVVSAKELAGGRRAWIHEEAAGRRWRISARSFFQNRPAGVDALVEVVDGMVDALGANGPMVDAYAGIGIFAGTIGQDRDVHAVERGRDSLADARINLDENRVKIVGSAVENWKAVRASLVLADPAREGLGVRGVEVLMGCQPELFVLVGCDPGSFARDAGLLTGAGLRLDRMTVVDMFPGTSHVETVGAFLPG
jgi:23S rRNA (uracil1939-C5)-methyltransferase